MKSIRSKILICMALTVSVSLAVTGALSSYLNYSSTIVTLEQSMRETAGVAAGFRLAQRGERSAESPGAQERGPAP